MYIPEIIISIALAFVSGLFLLIFFFFKGTIRVINNNTEAINNLNVEYCSNKAKCSQLHSDLGKSTEKTDTTIEKIQIKIEEHSNAIVQIKTKLNI